MESSQFSDEQRRRLVAMVVALTADTHLAPLHYERRLLARFERGELCLDQLTELLDQSTYQLLYHSHATDSPTDADLSDLLTRSHRYNAAHDITGLLLYSNRRYVQVLEGSEAAVSILFTKIQRDDRHYDVQLVRKGPAARRFDKWRMGFGQVEPLELQFTLNAINRQWPFRPPHVTDPFLLALLDAFTEAGYTA